MTTPKYDPSGDPENLEESAFDPYSDEVLELLAAEAGTVFAAPPPPQPPAKPRPLHLPRQEPALPPQREPPRAIAPARPPMPDAFELGDHVELARRLLIDIQGDSPEPIAYDEGSFWRYHPLWGIHQQVNPTELRRTVAGYSGMPVERGRGATPLHVSDSTINGVIAVCRDLSGQHEFFHSARRGIAFRDVFVTIEEGGIVTRAHSPLHRARHALPFEYRPDAPCPRWEQFLREVFTPIIRDDGEVVNDGADRAALVQEFFGGSLFGLAVRLGIALVLTGEGSNGKSVLLQVIPQIFPSAAVAALPPHEWGRPFSRADLVGKILNVVSEMPSGEINQSDLFKAVITGDRISAEQKYKPTFTFNPTAAHIFACNKLPVTRDHSYGYWRRFQVVHFGREFAESEQDTGLVDNLLAELPGIAAWVIQGASRLISQGRYTRPRSSDLAKSEWQKDTDQVQGFIEECVSRTNPKDRDPREPRDSIPSIATTVSELYDAYTRWAARAGHHAVSKVEFGRRMARHLQPGRCSVERYYFARLNDRGAQLLDLPPGMRNGLGRRASVPDRSDRSGGKNL